MTFHALLASLIVYGLFVNYLRDNRPLYKPFFIAFANADHATHFEYQVIRGHRHKPYSKVIDKVAMFEAGYHANRKLARINNRRQRKGNCPEGERVEPSSPGIRIAENTGYLRRDIQYFVTDYTIQRNV